jgi:hypothetical protein
MLVEVSYDKNSNKLIGTFNETYNYYWYYPKIRGKKIGDDFTFEMADQNSSGITYLQFGSIYLTPKKD